MTLLFDENLSPRLAIELSELFPQSARVRDVDLARADAEQVWRFAAEHGFAIVSMDADFHQSFLRGAPPKLVWIRRGNCSIAMVASLPCSRVDVMVPFDADPDASFLALQ